MWRAVDSTGESMKSWFVVADTEAPTAKDVSLTHSGGELPK